MKASLALVALFGVLLVGYSPDGGAAVGSPEPASSTRATEGTAAGSATVATNSAGQAAMSPGPASVQETWQVANVVDGDTVDVVSSNGRKERIRVIGIDTPERGECGFAAASAALARTVQGKVVTLVPGARNNRDKYNRLLRYLDVEGRDAGMELIEAGFAIARYDSRDGYGRHPREDAYVAAAAAAASSNICGRPSASLPGAPSPAATATTLIQVFRNCADLNTVYPGGVARVGVTGNTVSGSLRPFGITPHFDNALYEDNRARDGDADGIACEK